MIVTGLVAVYVLVVLRLQAQWWFEDDPYQIAYVTRHQPWEFFLSRESLSRGLVGLLFTPMQNLTYWIDGTLARTSAGFAYAHTALSLWVAMLLWLAVLRAWIGRIAALTVVVLTLLLPATIVVAEFISLRNYLDGLCLALAAIWLSQRAMAYRGGRYVACVAAAVVCAFLGSLAKELYVTTPFAIVALVFASHRRWGGVAAIAGAGVAYVAYYWWVIGSLTSTFDIPMLAPADYPRFLLKYPYIFAGGAAGWALAGLGVLAVARGVWRRQIQPRDVLVVALLVLIALASMSPAMSALDREYLTPGTWYRASFVSSLVILGGSAWLVRGASRLTRSVLAISTAAALTFGAVTAVRAWDALHARYRIEGQFYLANPDKLVYSELPAWWFLVGIDDLYRVPQRHYVIAARPGQAGDRELLEQFGSVWRYSPVIPGYFPAPDVFRQLSGAR